MRLLPVTALILLAAFVFGAWSNNGGLAEFVDALAGLGFLVLVVAGFIAGYVFLDAVKDLAKGASRRRR